MPKELILRVDAVIFFSDLVYFGTEKGPGRAREVFENLAGGRSFVLTEYEPVASHGDPIRDNFYGFGHARWCICVRVRHISV